MVPLVPVQSPTSTPTQTHIRYIMQSESSKTDESVAMFGNDSARYLRRDATDRLE